MYGSVNTLAAVVPKSHAPAANTDAVVTLAADASASHVVDQVLGGYTATPTSGLLTIAATVGGDAVAIVIPIAAAGPLSVVLDPPLQGDAGAEVKVTLAKGGATITGHLTVMTR